MFSVGTLTAFRTSSAKAFAVNEMQTSSAQLNAKKKGLTLFPRTFCSFAFIIKLNSVLSFMSTTQTGGTLFHLFQRKSPVLSTHSFAHHVLRNTQHVF